MPRYGEVDGVHYHFVTKEAFGRLALLESAVIHGEYYGIASKDVPADTVGANHTLVLDCNGFGRALQYCRSANIAHLGVELVLPEVERVARLVTRWVQLGQVTDVKLLAERIANEQDCPAPLAAYWPWLKLSTESLGVSQLADFVCALC
jgi:guanylate kinase